MRGSPIQGTRQPMDINNLLNQFFSGQANDQQPTQQENTTTGGGGWTDTAKNLAQKATQGGLGGFAGGAVTGGLLSLLLTNDKARKIAGGVAGYGGAAVLGAMALKAFQNYQSGKSNSASTTNDTLLNNTSVNGGSFGLILIKSMIMASKVDGHMDATEQQRIFSALEKSTLPADEKAIVLDALSRPVNLHEITTNIANQEQAAQVYLASRIAIDPDQPTEKEYLTNLAGALKLPAELVSQLENQVNGFTNTHKG